VWKFLKETLPKYQWPTEKAKVQEEEQVVVPNVKANNVSFFGNYYSNFQKQRLIV
jgi:hypothetical protein